MGGLHAEVVQHMGSVGLNESDNCSEPATSGLPPRRRRTSLRPCAQAVVVAATSPSSPATAADGLRYNFEFQQLHKRTELKNATLGDALRALQEHRAHIRSWIDAERHAQQLLANEHSTVSGGVAGSVAESLARPTAWYRAVFHGNYSGYDLPVDKQVQFPDPAMWDAALDALNQAEHFIRVGQLAGAVKCLNGAAAHYRKAHRKLYEYRQMTEMGAEGAIGVLQGIEVAGAISFTVATGGLGSTLLGTAAAASGGAAGYAVVQNVAEQSSELGFGVREHFDVGSILRQGTEAAISTFVGVLLGGALSKVFMHRIGEHIVRHLSSQQLALLAEYAGAGGRVTSELFVSKGWKFIAAFLGGVGSSPVVTAVSTLVHGGLTGEWPAERFVDRVVEELWRGALLQLLLAALHASRRQSTAMGTRAQVAENPQLRADAKLLGVPTDASAGEVRAAFRRIWKEHPELHFDRGGDEAHMTELTTARDRLLHHTQGNSAPSQSSPRPTVATPPPPSSRSQSDVVNATAPRSATDWGRASAEHARKEPFVATQGPAPVVDRPHSSPARQPLESITDAISAASKAARAQAAPDAESPPSQAVQVPLRPGVRSDGSVATPKHSEEAAVPINVVQNGSRRYEPLYFNNRTVTIDYGTQQSIDPALRSAIIREGETVLEWLPPNRAWIRYDATGIGTIGSSGDTRAAARWQVGALASADLESALRTAIVNKTASPERPIELGVVAATAVDRTAASQPSVATAVPAASPSPEARVEFVDFDENGNPIKVVRENDGLYERPTINGHQIEIRHGSRADAVDPMQRQLIVLEVQRASRFVPASVVLKYDAQTAKGSAARRGEDKPFVSWNLGDLDASGAVFNDWRDALQNAANGLTPTETLMLERPTAAPTAKPANRRGRGGGRGRGFDLLRDQEGEEAEAEKITTAEESKLAAPSGPVKADPAELENALKELNDLEGLDGVKLSIANIRALIEVNQTRTELGLRVQNTSLHALFQGNPGTGKTVVARLYGKILRALGRLPKGQFVEVARADLVGSHLGESEEKTLNKLQEADGGVFFVDEAPALVTDERDNFGKEALTTILKFMEDHRKTMVVIFAGYAGKMKALLARDQGLASRFGQHVPFEDYSDASLARILKIMTSQAGYRVSDETADAVVAKIAKHRGQKDFANARDVRNAFEAAMLKQASRLSASKPNVKALSAEERDQLKTRFMELLPEDFG